MKVRHDFDPSDNSSGQVAYLHLRSQNFIPSSSNPSETCFSSIQHDHKVVGITRIADFKTRLKLASNSSLSLDKARLQIRL
jgi:hypothetical protein